MSRHRARHLAVVCVAGAIAAAGCTTAADTADAHGTADASATVDVPVGEVIDVPIPADGIELDGSLHLPATGPPFDAVVIVHGSGPLSRRGEVPGQLGLTFPRPVPVYEQLAVGLQQRGFAVLTWDKRTCGRAHGCADRDHPHPATDVTVDSLRDDAEAAVDALAANPDVGSLAVLGHSQGGTLAIEIAATHDEVDAVVLAGTTPQPLDGLLAGQARKLEELTEAVGQRGSAADAAVAEVRDLAEQVATLAAGGETPEVVGGAPVAYWRSWAAAARRAPELAGDLEVPVLALGGGQDWNAPADEVVGWRRYLGADDEVRILDGITHALTRLEPRDPGDITPADVGDEVDPQVVAVLAEWLETAVVDRS